MSVDAAAHGIPETRLSSPLPGIILAGGQASRLGGGHKGMLLLGGRTILARIIDRLVPQCGLLVLSANTLVNPSDERVSSIVPDDAQNRGCGPLAGLLAGLDWAARQSTAIETILTVPTDAPFLPADLVSRLQGVRDLQGVAVAYARSGGRDHYLSAIWPVSLAQTLRDALRCGERRVGDFVRSTGSAAVEWPTVPLDPFFNVNTPDDVAAAERWAT